MTMPDKEEGPGKRALTARAERLEAELKANLKKRKAQARARASEVGKSPASSTPAGARERAND